MDAREISPEFAAPRSGTRATRLPVDLLWAGATAVIALIVYALTLAPDLTWANFGSDGGELIAAAVTLGIPHPPGYPTYVLLGKLWSYLPVGTMALRFNLLSAVSVALAVGVACLTALELTRTRVAAVAAALSLAFAPLVWGQALVTEVYGLNLLCLALFLWALLGQRPSGLTGLLLGLSLTTHLTSWLMLPLALALTPRRRWLALSAGMALGLTPLLVLPLLARSGSPVIWGDPTTPSGWWWLVTAQVYRATLAGASAESWPALLWTFARQFAVIGLAFVAAGVIGARGLRRRLLWLAATAVAYLLFALFYATGDTAVNLLPALLLLTFPLAAGLQTVGRWALILPLALLLLALPSQSLRDDTAVRPLAVAALEAAPANAILLTPGDRTIFTLWYFQGVEALRPDVILVDYNLLAFDWYRARLQARYPDLQALATDDPAAFEQANLQLRPFCRAALLANPTIICHEESLE